MGTLAIDIETASPDGEPPDGEFDKTQYFELVAVALGYRAESGTSVESDVLFREGGWDEEHTATLLERVIEWSEGRDVDDVLTYNGTGFDFVHLNNWAEDIDAAGLGESVENRIRTLDSKQIDLKIPAIEYHRDLIWNGHDFPKFEKVCDARSISVAETRYSNYDIDSEFFQERGVYGSTVEGKHVGRSLGEEYVTGLARGLGDTPLYRELQKVLFDYAEEDVRRLFDLYGSFDDSDWRRVSGRE